MRPTDNVVRYRGLALCCVPKAANTSQKWAVLQAQGIAPEYRRHRHKALNLGRPDQTAGYYTAAFVRHPCARLYSAWHDKVRRRKGPASARLEALGFRIGMAWPDFVVQACGRAHEDVHIRPQVDFLPARLDFLGCVEHLREDWAKLQARFAWLPDLGRHNSAANNQWQDACPPEIRDVIERCYAADHALWLSALGTKRGVIFA